jgi:hypothetical protein
MKDDGSENLSIGGVSVSWCQGVVVEASGRML